LFTIDGYDWRVSIGIGIHVAAMLALAPFTNDQATPFMAVGILGLYILLAMVTRRPPTAY